MPKSEVSIVEVNGQKIVLPKADKPKGLDLPVKMNRQQRRSMQRRTTGAAGKNSKRPRPTIHVESEEDRAVREFHESQTRSVEAARNIRDATAGNFWLPGDK